MITATDTSWVEILKECGYPTEVVILDFECYFDDDYSLKKMSTIEYIMSPQFEALGVARLLMSGRQPHADPEQNCLWNADIDSCLEWLKQEYGDNLEGCTLVAQNTRFDGSILAFRYGIRPKYSIDLKGLSAYIDPHKKAGLAELCKRYGLTPKGDTMDFKEATRQLRWKKPRARKRLNKMPFQIPRMTPEMEQKLGGYACNDALQEWNLFPLMLPKIANARTELRLMHHTLEMFWSPSIRVDFDLGEKIHTEMLEMVDIAATEAGHTAKELSGNHSFRDLLTAELDTTGDRLPVKPNKKNEMIPAIAKADPERKELENHKNPKIRKLMAGRAAVKAWPSKAIRVSKIMAQARANNGVLPVPLKYYAGHTGRWGGDEKINLQNLGARGHPLDTQVRNMLLPPEDHVFVIADQMGIEARVLAWIAGQEDLLDAFDKGRDVYCEFASAVVGSPIRKARPTDPDIVAKHLKRSRNLGKVGVLGGGYGMGPDKCRTYAVGYGVALTSAEARLLIDTYRRTNDRIVRFWSDIERAFVYTTRYGKPCDLDRELHFRREEDTDTTIIRLPSGRELRYDEACVVGTGRGQQLKYWNDIEQSWVHMWGGFLTENVVQAISRDILSEAILWLEDRGWKIPLTVHDELVINCPKDRVDEGTAIALEALRKRPEWAKGCPLDAEIYVSERYTK